MKKNKVGLKFIFFRLVFLVGVATTPIMERANNYINLIYIYIYKAKMSACLSVHTSVVNG